MTALGTADAAIFYNPTQLLYGDLSHTIGDRLYLGPADSVYAPNAKHGVVIPTVGQLWPRKVWQYNDYVIAPAGTLGYANRIHDYFQYGIIRNVQYYGQLWPRGDYIANAWDEVKRP